MKKGIHPEYHIEAKTTCACGVVFQIGSTKKDLAVEICSNCHPFYTGKEKLIDTAGKVEKFKARREKAKGAPKRSRTEKRKVKSEKKAQKTAKG